MKQIFIDGSAGTTGLQIADRLKNRDDIEVITLPPELEQDKASRERELNRCDIAFLCLPDEAAGEAVTLIHNDNTVVIDASTAHRTAKGWVYGFPEIGNRRHEIATAKRIANPGCHAGGFIALAAPLREHNLIPAKAALSCTSITGYSGGGRNMITQYEENHGDKLLSAPRLYGLSQNHKHLPEMKSICGLSLEPVFMPLVAPFYKGMEVLLPLRAEDVACPLKELKDFYYDYYNGNKNDLGLVIFNPRADREKQGFLSAAEFAGRDIMEISISGNDERAVLCARFDNLGKGASGSAIQNMNIVLGTDETKGLVL